MRRVARTHVTPGAAPQALLYFTGGKPQCVRGDLVSGCGYSMIGIWQYGRDNFPIS